MSAENTISADSFKRLKQMVNSELSARRAQERRSASLERQLDHLYLALDRLANGEPLQLEVQP